jgi:ATP/maltotriose-dependent transcriptional regulator MalT
MSVDNQYPGLRWSKSLEGLFESYKKQKPVFNQLKNWLKEIDGELHHEIMLQSDKIDKKIELLKEQNETIKRALKETGSFALMEVEESLACLQVVLDVLKTGTEETEKLPRVICLRQSLRRLDYSLGQLLLFMKAPFLSLTSREQEILVCLAEGLSNEEIANKLYISIKTVKNHVSSVYRKSGIRERTKLVLAAREFLG